jgi:hypothetical protein
LLGAIPSTDAAAWKQLESELARPLPDGKRVISLAEQARGKLDTLPAFDGSGEMLKIVDRAVRDTAKPAWDDVIQRCLALAAWRRSVKIGDGPGELSAKMTAEVDEFLARFHRAFPRGYDSPRGADPAELNKELATLLQRLPKPR